MSIPVRGKDNWIATIITWMFFQNIVADNCKCMHIYVRDTQCPFYTNHANSFLFFVYAIFEPKKPQLGLFPEMNLELRVGC